MKLKIEPDFESLLPPLTEDEFAQLKENLKANPDGFPPIIVWGNNSNVIIDGHNQYKARIALGLPIKTKKMNFETRQEALSFAVKCQLGRRNLSASERAKAVANLVTTTHGGADRFSQAAKLPLGEKPDEFSQNSQKRGLTQKQAAKAAGVSERTVRDAVKTKDTNTNGAVSKAAKQAREEFNPPPLESLEDSVGQAVPDKLRLIFEAAKEFDAQVRVLIKVQQWAKDAAEKPEGVWIHLQSLKADIDNAKRALKFNKPYAVCPYCAAKKSKCEACHGNGFVSKRLYESAPQEMRV